MFMKKGIRYLRFSSVGQSNGSIEWQDMYTQPWFERNNVELIDTYIDAGYSARTFDRPDMAKLTEFIAKYYRMVDYLVVCEMDRFSRDAGEALTLAKKLQTKYNVQIVSVVEGITFDYRDNGSFFRTGLSLLLAEDDNIRRTNKINSGIYTAKAREGRYIHGQPPYGYTKEGKGKEAGLVINEEQAKVVRFIYEAFLHNTPLYKIREEAKKMGFSFTSNSYVQKILSLPVYSGQQHVKPWRDLPGGVFPANHEAIIDMFTWQQVQRKLKGELRTRVTISDEMPLRGVLHCHCSRLLTGAPSTGRHGKLFYYYKCHTSRQHNHIAAKKVHEQVNETMKYLSLPKYFVSKLKNRSSAIMEDRMKENKKLVVKKKNELKQVEKQLESVEEKFIQNQLKFDTYNRWHTTYNQQRITLLSEIEKYSADYNEFFFVLNNNLEKLTDMQHIYNRCTTLQKQELLRKVFDNKLYYQNGLCRTPQIMKIFRYNLLILKEKSLLIVDEKGDFREKVPSGGAERSRTAVQTYLP
jgi:site-specific DNA recombinase